MHRATCRRFETIPACDGQTDGQTDEIAVASTALAMQALRRAVKAASGSVVAQSIAFRVVSIYCEGVAPFPCYLNAKGPIPIISTWRRAVLSADAGLVVNWLLNGLYNRLVGWSLPFLFSTNTAVSETNALH